MVPPTIVQNLASLRRRERLLTLAWGLACWIALTLGLLVLCAAADWLIDRNRDTPMPVRTAFLLFQFVAAVLAGLFFLLWPQLKSMPDESLALFVESKVRNFDHRLISAVQLNLPNADLGGMSKELIAVMTREAVREADRHGFASTADHRRLGWGAGLAIPAVLVFLVPFLIAPSLCFTLLERQALLDREIPRSVKLENVSTDVWPMNETIPIRIRVKGKFREDMVGRVTVWQQQGHRWQSDDFELTFLKQDGDDALFGADVAGTSGDIRYSARLADGRTRAPSEMRIVPRPVIVKNDAFIVLPAYCGTRPDGGRYERPQIRGDVVGIPGSAVRVQMEVRRPIKEAWLELKGVEKADAKPVDDDAPIREVSKGKLPMQITRLVDPDTKLPIEAWQAEATFDLTEELTGYVMGVVDVDDFDNIPKPRRALRLIPEEPPQVVLLKDTFDLGEGSTFDLEGLPVVLGAKIRIPYRADGAYGLSEARILYRVLKKHESGEAPQQEPDWTKLPLFEDKKHPGPKYGDFDPKRGVFTELNKKPDFLQQVPFHAVPSSFPERFLGRTTGGGRVFLKTDDGALRDSENNVIKLKSGDQIEYCVEVFAMPRPGSATPSSRSETRVATMMSLQEFQAWFSAVAQEDERVRQLEQKQRGIFEQR